VALPTNIILGWKGFPGTNTLYYYKKSLITNVKSFTILGTGPAYCTFCYMFYRCFCAEIIPYLLNNPICLIISLFIFFITYEFAQ
jgi:hypothetical protein